MRSKRASSVVCLLLRFVWQHLSYGPTMNRQHQHRELLRFALERRRKNILLACSLLLIAADEEDAKVVRSVWTQPYLLRRKNRGMHYNLFLELAVEDPNRFRRCLRMDTDTFEFILQKVSPLIRRRDTHLRESIPPEERLSITLRHLATGETQESLRQQFRVGQSTISGIIKNVCGALIQVMEDEYLRVPSSMEEWKNVADNFGLRWQFHNCIGAMDGKHIRIDPPLSSGSTYYNYKDFHSIVLLAVVDAQLRFIFYDVGTNGRMSDTHIWNKCGLKDMIDKNTLPLPPDSPLPGTVFEFPYVLIGDEIFPVTNRLLAPYPGLQLRNRLDRRIFNYRLSRARRCSENAFGVLGARFQIFRGAMRYDPDDASTITKACMCLHNFLRSQSVGAAMYTPPQFLDEEDILTGHLIHGEWREEQARGLVPLHRQGGNRRGAEALALRERWTQYFMGPGAVSWQERMVTAV